MDAAVSIDTTSFTIDGKTVVVINVDEIPVHHKPCKYNKVAYKRQFDGDHRMSLQEEQQLLLRHTRPRTAAG